MQLKAYIETVGDNRFADMIGCTERAAASWRRGEKYPNRDNIKKIVKVTNKQVTAAGCLGIEE